MNHPFDAASSAARHGTLASSVYERLRQDVLTGELLPGHKLRIDALRLRYGVGASPVREALNRLVSEGLVTLEDQKGFRVAPVSLDELRELTHTRCLINEIALRESIARGGEDWEERIVLAFHRMMRARRRGQAPDAELERAHRAFHAALIDACGSRWITGFSETLFDRTRRYRSLAINAPSEPRDIEAEHRHIMDAVLARDTPLAVKLLNEHVLLTADIVTRLEALQKAAAAVK